MALYLNYFRDTGTIVNTVDDEKYNYVYPEGSELWPCTQEQYDMVTGHLAAYHIIDDQLVDWPET